MNYIYINLQVRFLSLSTEYRGSPDIPHCSAYRSLPVPIHLHPRLHWICLQADAAPLLPPNMGVSGHHGLSVHVLWGETQPVGPGTVDKPLCLFPCMHIWRSILYFIVFLYIANQNLLLFFCSIQTVSGWRFWQSEQLKTTMKCNFSEPHWDVLMRLNLNGLVARTWFHIVSSLIHNVTQATFMNLHYIYFWIFKSQLNWNQLNHKNRMNRIMKRNELDTTVNWTELEYNIFWKSSVTKIWFWPDQPKIRFGLAMWPQINCVWEFKAKICHMCICHTIHTAT